MDNETNTEAALPQETGALRAAYRDDIIERMAATAYLKPAAPPEPQTPAIVAEDRSNAAPNEQIARELWKDQSVYAGVVTPADIKLNVPEEQKAAMISGMQEKFGDWNLTTTDASVLMNVVRAGPPDDQTWKAWRTDAERMLLSMNGGDPKGAKQDLERAKALLARDPRVIPMIRAMGAEHLGDHPGVIEILVHAARRARVAGRL